MRQKERTRSRTKTHVSFRDGAEDLVGVGNDGELVDALALEDLAGVGARDGGQHGERHGQVQVGHVRLLPGVVQVAVLLLLLRLGRKVVLLHPVVVTRRRVSD